MRTLPFAWNSGRSLLLFLAIFALYLGVLLPQTQNYPYYTTDFNAFTEAAEIRSNFLAGWGLDADGRRHPLFYYTFFLETQLFGINPLGYFVVLLTLHLVNSLLVARICQVLGGSGVAQILSGILFLVTSASYQNIVIICSTTRVLSILFVLLAALGWIDFLRSRRLSSFLKTIAFQTLGLLSMEDAVIFPLLAFLLTWAILPGQKERWQIGIRFLPLLVAGDGLVASFVLSDFFFSPDRGHWISGLDNLFWKFVSLIEMFLRPLFLPDKGFLPQTVVPENLLRLVPSILILSWGISLLAQRERLRFFFQGLPKRLIGISLGWMFLSVIPFLLHSLTFEHANRYVYLPFVGFSWLFGVLGSRFLETAQIYFRQIGIVLVLATMGYLVGLNLSSVAYNYHRYERYASEHGELHYLDRVKELLSRSSNPISFITTYWG